MTGLSEWDTLGRMPATLSNALAQVVMSTLVAAHTMSSPAGAYPAWPLTRMPHRPRASRRKETVVISPEELDQEALKKAVEATGYQVLSVSTEPYEKKGFFSFGK